MILNNPVVIIICRSFINFIKHDSFYFFVNNCSTDIKFCMDGLYECESWP